MTEPERIYSEKWLPEEFWEESFYCDYRVTKQMKRVWAIELDLYREFARVCEKNGLRYFVDGGTALGTVRHGGFIPWDDDLDVCMPRASYEKLKQMTKEFKFPYFLQNSYTDPEYAYSFMRLRNQNTTVVVKPFHYCKFSQGIYIDIFPLDKVTKEDYLPRRRKMYELIMRNSAYMRYCSPEKTHRDMELILQYQNEFTIPWVMFEDIENLATQDENLETEYISLLVSTQYNAERKIWPKRIFDGYIEKDFESIKVRVPVGYDEWLRIYFVNYMEYPPIEQRGVWHDIDFYPDIPYRKYYREKYGIEYDE